MNPINLNCYIGRLVEWCYGYPKGPMGILEEGHQRIADEVSKYLKYIDGPKHY